jgi:hypothetical protein
MIKNNLNKNWVTFFFGVFLIVLSVVLFLSENLKQVISIGTMILGIILVIASISKPIESKKLESTSNSNEPKNDGKNTGNKYWEGKDSATDSQTLIERFDSKNSTHITAFVAIIFGAFTILTFLEGKGFPPTEANVWILFIVESAIFPLAIVYCLVRSFYYSWCAERVKLKSNLHIMENIVSDEAIEKIPNSLIKKMAHYRTHMKNSTIIYYVMPIVWLIWIVIIITVLHL